MNGKVSFPPHGTFKQGRRGETQGLGRVCPAFKKKKAGTQTREKIF